MREPLSLTEGLARLVKRNKMDPRERLAGDWKTMRDIAEFAVRARDEGRTEDLKDAEEGLKLLDQSLEEQLAALPVETPSGKAN